MTLDPLLFAPPAVQLHVAAAIVALIVGPVALYRRRRDRWHRRVGTAWVTAMAVLAVSGLFIKSDVLPLVGPFGPIHLLSLAVIVGLWRGIVHIRAGRIAAHRATMRDLYWQAMGIAGLLTLIPGRRINRVLFPDAPELGWAVIAAVLVLAGFAWARGRRRTVSP